MRRYILVLLLVSVASVVYSLSSVAVFDAYLEDGVDAGARVPITEKIIEEFVASGEFTVLDRGNVARVLEEIEFQMSGLVKENEVKRAGEYMGADIVCIASVSRVGSKYFISGKLIEVETGKIITQKSFEQAGTVEVVLELAELVGKALVGDDTAESALPVKKTPEVAQTEAKPAIPAQTAAPLAGPVGYMSLALGTSSFSGDVYDQIDNEMTFSNPMHKSTNLSLDMRGITPYRTSLYTSYGLSIPTQITDIDGAGSEESTELHFVAPAFKLGGGYIRRIGRALQLYAGGGLAVLVLAPGDVWLQNHDEMVGVGYFIEIGADLINSSPILNAAVQIAGGGVGDGLAYPDNASLNYFSVFVGIAIPF